MKIAKYVRLSRLLLTLRGAIGMYECEGLEIASILSHHGDIDLSLAWHEMGMALYHAQDTINEVIQELQKPEHLPQHSGERPTDPR